MAALALLEAKPSSGGKIARFAALHKISLEMVRRNAYCALQQNSEES
ncbi:MAG TPA: hypothetical protein VE221_02105 [Sphingomicrobium sp.]|nr:hypothetical protein [Sphingomicrobium sp.]